MPESAPRRLIAADSLARLTDVIGDLRRRGYTRLGTWSLPQICHHLAIRLEAMLRDPPATTEQSPELAEAWQKLLAVATTPPGIPAGMKQNSATEDPPVDCGDDQCDRLIAVYKALDAWPHSHVMSPRFGPIPVGEMRRFQLAHANHHLSFLLPKPEGRAGLEYPDVAAALADVARLRQGYTRTGQWSLAQNAYHVARSLKERMRPEAAGDPDTPEQRARHAARDRVLNDNVIAAGLTSPPASTPPADLTDDAPAGQAAIDDLVEQLKRFDQYPHEFPPHRLYGRMTRDQVRRHQLVHAAHHLSHLVPQDGQ